MITPVNLRYILGILKMNFYGFWSARNGLITDLAFKFRSMPSDNDFDVALYLKWLLLLFTEQLRGYVQIKGQSRSNYKKNYNII